MTFTSETREEIVRIKPVCERCDLATLSALIRIDGTIYLSGSGKYRIEISTDFASVGRFIVQKLHDIYSLKTSISYRQSVLHHTRNYQIDVPFQKNIKSALTQLGILGTNNTLERGIAEHLIEKDCCKKAYLRGAFLGSGFIAGPKSGHHLEIVLSSRQIADEITEILGVFDVVARVVKRRNNYMIYMKSGNEIVKFLGCVGAHNSALALEQVRVYKSVRNDVNRSINAEIANTNRLTHASLDQMRAIEIILKNKDIDELPPAIRDFIELRSENPTLSLKQLGEISDPPLSKSGINNRCRRTLQLAADIEKNLK